MRYRYNCITLHCGTTFVMSIDHILSSTRYIPRCCWARMPLGASHLVYLRLGHLSAWCHKYMEQTRILCIEVVFLSFRCRYFTFECYKLARSLVPQPFQRMRRGTLQAWFSVMTLIFSHDLIALTSILTL